MSNEEHAKSLKDVKFTMNVYSLVSLGSILLAIAGVYYGLKGDIVETRTYSREQIEHATNRLNTKIDSIHSSDLLEFQDIRQQLSTLSNTSTVTRRTYAHPAVSYGLYIQRMINGKLTFIPYR